MIMENVHLAHKIVQGVTVQTCVLNVLMDSRSKMENVFKTVTKDTTIIRSLIIATSVMITIALLALPETFVKNVILLSILILRLTTVSKAAHPNTSLMKPQTHVNLVVKNADLASITAHVLLVTKAITGIITLAHLHVLLNTILLKEIAFLALLKIAFTADLKDQTFVMSVT